MLESRGFEGFSRRRKPGPEKTLAKVFEGESPNVERGIRTRRRDGAERGPKNFSAEKYFRANPPNFSKSF